MHAPHEARVRLQVRGRVHAVGRVVVVGAQADDDDVGGRVRGKVPARRGVAVQVDGARRRVGGVEPLVGLAAGVAPAGGVDEADARVGGDGVVGAAEAGGEGVGPRGEGFVGGVLAGGEGVADDFEGAGGAGERGEGGGGGEVDAGDLDAVGPVGDAQFEGAEGGGSGEVEAWGGGGDEGMGGVGGDVGEGPVEAVEAIGDEDAGGGVGAEGDCEAVAGEGEFEAGGAGVWDEFGLVGGFLYSRPPWVRSC